MNRIFIFYFFKKKLPDPFLDNKEGIIVDANIG